jgi:hypothetical protein
VYSQDSGSAQDEVRSAVIEHSQGSGGSADEVQSAEIEYSQKSGSRGSVPSAEIEYSQKSGSRGSVPSAEIEYSQDAASSKTASVASSGSVPRQVLLDMADLEVSMDSARIACRDLHAAHPASLQHLQCLDRAPKNLGNMQFASYLSCNLRTAWILDT